MRDGMIDLETLGTRPGCIVLSVGVRQFDPTSDAIGESFYAKITRESCEEIGLTADESTMRWWDSQSREARDEAFTGGRPAGEVMSEMQAFWRGRGLMRPWSQGANFDEPILVTLLHRLGMSAPWKFWDSRCTRTAYALAGLNIKTVPRIGTHHKAIDDCDHQVRCVQKSYRMLKLNH